MRCCHVCFSRDCNKLFFCSIAGSSQKGLFHGANLGLRSFLSWKPVPLAPPVEGKGFGKRGSVEGRQVFPTVLFVIVACGGRVEEGWTVLGAMRCTSVQNVGP